MLLRAGPTINGNDPGNADLVALAVELDPRTPPTWLTYPGDDLHYELTVGRIIDAEPPEDSVAFVGTGIDWHYRPALLPDPAFIEIGPAVTVRSEDRINGVAQGGDFFFTLQTTLGTYLGASGRGRLALRLEHTSNAGIERPNPGINAFMLELGYRWR